MKTFRVVRLIEETQSGPSQIVEASTPEAAAKLALGIEVVRGSSKYAKPVAKVYWEGGPQQTNMIRFYARTGRVDHQSKGPATVVRLDV